VKSGTNSINKGYRKIRIKKKVIEGAELIKLNNVRISMITKFYKAKKTNKGRKLLPLKNGN